MKHEKILTDGKYIAVRTYYNYKINLYILDDIFYEVWYLPEANEIEKIERLHNEKSLNLYIDFMNQLDKNQK